MLVLKTGSSLCREPQREQRYEPLSLLAFGVRLSAAWQAVDLVDSFFWLPIFPPWRNLQASLTVR
jgi:hypothetical protein